jgi:hypothetical protein
MSRLGCGRLKTKGISHKGPFSVTESSNISGGTNYIYNNIGSACLQRKLIFFLGLSLTTRSRPLRVEDDELFRGNFDNWLDLRS